MLLGIPSGALMRFDDEQTATLVGVFGDEATAGFLLGDRLASSRAWRRGRCSTEGKVGRVDGYERVPGDVARADA